jgi:uncharacterized protein (TIGR04255 family)
MGKKMSNAPVYFTVAQVRFNPILDLEAYLPAIQGKLRAAHFPDFKRESIHRLVLPFSAADGGQVPAPSFQPHARCIFGNIEGTSSLVLEHNSLALQTTAYDTFETFSESFLLGLSIVHEILSLDFSERLGLRYLDAVLPKEGESLTDYLVPEVLGLSQRLAGMTHSFTETVVSSAVGQLTARVVIQDGELGLPQELMPLAPKLASRFTQHSGVHAIIDTDAYQQQRQPLNLDELGNALVAQHDAILEAFRATVTDYAIKAWE